MECVRLFIGGACSPFTYKRPFSSLCWKIYFCLFFAFLRASLSHADGVEKYVQKKKTITLEKGKWFDSHVYDGRQFCFVIRDKFTNERLGEQSCMATALHAQMRGNSSHNETVC